MKQADLSPFGLDENQSKTYLTLLQIGSAGILEISKQSGINRSMLYDIVDSLIELGIVYKSMRGKKVRFVAREPEALQALLTQKLEKFEKILPDLKILVAEGSTKPTVTFHEGLAGIKQVYLGATHSKEKKLYAFVGVESLLSKTNVLETFWDEEFKNERKKRNVFGQLLVPDNAAGKKFQAKDNRNFRESKLVNTDLYNFPAEVLIYDDTVTFISYSQHEEYAVEIKSPAIAETLKMAWRFMWEASKVR
ncbi:MAG: helix-turn-helix domain-containing protein [Candidatus Uhrbacteria bacterium]|nr:helix-turn-helix domain-containing protein [Candidatus Uhrbacteria bacterium]